MPDYNLGQARGQIRITADTRGVDQARTALEAAEQEAVKARAKIETALRNLPDVKIDADSSSVDRELALIRARLEQLKGNVDVGVNTGEAQTEIATLEARLREVSAGHHDVEVRANVRRALTDLAGVNENLSEIARQRPPVITPEVDSATFEGRFKSALEGAQRSIRDIRISPDTSQVDRALARIRDQIGSLSARRINVDISVQDALSAVSDLQEQLQALGEGSFEGIDELEDKIKELAALNPDVEIDAKADISQALRNLGIISSEIQSLEHDPSVIDVRVNPDLATFNGRIQAAVAAARASIGEIRIDVSTNQATREVNQLRNDLAALSSRRIGVDISAADALAQLERIADELNAVDSDEVDIQVRADVARALAQLRAVRAEANALDKKDVSIRALLKDGGTLDSFTQRLNIVIAAFATLLPALVTVGSVGVAALGGLTSAAASLLPAIGAIVLAFSGIGEVLSAGVQAQNDSAKNAKATADQQISAANAVDSAQRNLVATQQQAANNAILAGQQQEAAAYRVAQAYAAVQSAAITTGRAQELAAREVISAQRDLEKAVSDAARANANAQNAVRDAAEQVQETAVSSARAITSANRSLAQAQRQVVQAFKSEVAAQKQLDQARKAARRNIEDLARAVRNGALDAKQASLDIRGARQSLQEALAGGDPLEIAQARLNLQKAQNAASDVTQDNERNFQDFAEAMQAGVEGAQQVVAALENLANVQQQIADAQQAQVDAQQAVADAQDKAQKDARNAAERLQNAQDDQQRAYLDGLQAIADAQTRLADAQYAQQEQARTGAQQQADAQRQLFEAQQAQADQARAAQLNELTTTNSLISAQQSLEAAIRSQQKAIENTQTKFQEMYDLLSPAQQKFVDYFLTLRPVLDDLTDAASGGLLPGVQRGLEAALTVLPQTISLLQTFSSILGDIAEEAGRAFASDQNLRFFEFLERTGRPALEGMATAVGDLVASVQNIAEAFEPILGDTITQLTNFTGYIRRFTEGLPTNPDFIRFLGYIRENAPLVRDTLNSVFQAILNLTIAFGEAGPSILRVIGLFANLIAAIPPKVLAALIVGFGGLFLAIKALGAIAGVVSTITTLLPIFSALATFITGTVLPAIGGLITTIGGGLVAALGAISAPVLIVIAVIAALIAIFVILYKNVEGFRDFVNTAWQTIVELFTHPLDSIKTAVDYWSDAVPKALGAVGDYIADDFGKKWAGVEKFVIDPLQRAYDYVSNVFTNTIPNFFSDMGDKVSTFLTEQWTNVEQNVIAPVGRAIDYLQQLPDRVTTYFTNMGMDVGNWLAQQWTSVEDSLIAPVRNAATGVVNYLSGLRDTVINKFNDVVGIIRNLPNSILNLFSNAGQLLVNAGRNIINGLINGIIDAIPGLNSVLNFITDKIPDWKGPKERDAKLLVNTGTIIMQGLEDGIKNQLPSLKGLLNNVGTATIPESIQAAATSSAPVVNVAAPGVTVTPTGGNTFTFNTYGSDPVRNAEVTTRKMRQLQALGAFGG